MTRLDEIRKRAVESPDSGPIDMHPTVDTFRRRGADRRWLLARVDEAARALQRARTGCIVDEPAPICGCLGCEIDEVLAALDAPAGAQP